MSVEKPEEEKAEKKEHVHRYDGHVRAYELTTPGDEWEIAVVYACTGSGDCKERLKVSYGTYVRQGDD